MQAGPGACLRAFARSGHRSPDPARFATAWPAYNGGVSDSSKIAKNLRAFQMAINAHNEQNPDHNVLGLGLAGYDIERLGLEIGEEILPGVPICEINVTVGNFRVLCDGEHDEGIAGEAREAEPVEAVSREKVPVIVPARTEVGAPASNRLR